MITIFKRFFTLSLIGACGALTSTASFAAESTILCLGDSITQGGGSFVSYREILAPALAARNVSVQFIGPNKDAVSAHAGFGGKSTADLLKMSKEIYEKYPADIVLIHSGHNSFSENKPVAGIVRDTEAIMANMRAINPKVKFLLAQVIPSGKLPKYSYIPELNTELAILAKRMADEGTDITLVNQAEGFKWETDTIADHVHPNRAGASKMADKWLAALLPLLGHTKMATATQLQLWDGPAPGVPADAPSETLLLEGRVSGVTVPTLDVYQPEKPNGIGLLICSGGGYAKLASGPLGLGAADEFLKDGYTVFSLKYRLSLPSSDVVKDATTDGARALRLIRSHAKEWGLDPERIGMIGFSAGSNMILNLACQNQKADPRATDPLEKHSGMPDFIVLACPWRHKQLDMKDFALHAEMPPVLILNARDDSTATATQAEAMAAALQDAGIAVQLELYEKGGHMGFNFPKPANADWPERFRIWLKANKLDVRKPTP